MTACLRCGHETQPYARFCEQCGGVLAERCAACAVPLPPASRFCPACGQSVSAPADRPASTPTEYTPAYLKERILTCKDALEGERKHVTVLFADLKRIDGAGGRSRSRGGARLLDACWTHDGRRAPLRGHRQPGHGRRNHGALRRPDRPRGPRAARLLRRAGHAAARRRVRAGGASHPGRAGADPRRAELRRGGGALHPSDLHMDYTAIGQTTHLAAPDGADRDAGDDPACRGDVAPRRGLRGRRALGPGR